MALLGILPGLFIAKTLITVLGEYYAAEVEGVRPYFDFGLDPIVVAYAVGVAIVAGLLFGAIPGQRTSTAWVGSKLAAPMQAIDDRSYGRRFLSRKWRYPSCC